MYLIWTVHLKAKAHISILTQSQCSYANFVLHLTHTQLGQSMGSRSAACTHLMRQTWCPLLPPFWLP